MRAGELAHRFREKVSNGMERIGLRAGVPGTPIDFTGFLQTSVPRFYRGVQTSQRDFLTREFPDWVDRAVEEADRLCRHEVELLGFGRIELGPEIDWHRDPVTGKIWERRFWTDYRLENDAAGRDAKIIHELNRQQHLPRLAKAYHLTGEERYAAEAVAQMESWMEQNPRGLGVNWHSSLEIAIRSMSWLWTLFLMLGSRSLARQNAQRIGASLYAQLEHVHRHTSLYSSPNTHLIGEAAALFIAGTVFDAARWRDHGARLLEAEAEKQILADGVYGELSSYYHCYALDFYLQAMALARQNGAGFSPRVEARVCAMLEFLLHVTRPDGTIPRLGDDDGGRALALASRDYRGFRDGLCLGAILFARPDFKYCAGSFWEEAWWLEGAEAWDRYREIECREPVECAAFFPEGGYCTQRSGWGPRASHLVFDCGGLGMLTGGHSHADSLSVTLYGNGRDLLVDPGTYVYNGAPEWREYFRSTRAHNTVEIDGCDQAQAGGAFRWNTRIDSRMTGASVAPSSAGSSLKMGTDCSVPARELFTPRETAAVDRVVCPHFQHPPGEASNDNVGYLEAWHAGYMRLEQGVTHRRRVLHVPGEYWILADDFTGAGEHTFDFWYHFGEDVVSPDFENRDTGLTLWSASAGLLMGMFASGPVDAQLRSDWASRGYGHKSSTLSLRARLTGATPALALTVLAPTMARPILKRLSVERVHEMEGSGSPLETTGYANGSLALMRGRREDGAQSEKRGPSAPSKECTQTRRERSEKLFSNRQQPDDSDRPGARQGGSATAFSLRQGAVEDIVVFSDGKAELAAAGFRMKGEFFRIRMEHGEVRQTFAAGPEWLKRGDRDLLDRDRSGVSVESPVCAASAAF
jgi:hypothetical protein